MALHVVHAALRHYLQSFKAMRSRLQHGPSAGCCNSNAAVAAQQRRWCCDLPALGCLLQPPGAAAATSSISRPTVIFSTCQLHVVATASTRYSTSARRPILARSFIPSSASLLSGYAASVRLSEKTGHSESFVRGIEQCQHRRLHSHPCRDRLLRASIAAASPTGPGLRLGPRARA